MKNGAITNSDVRLMHEGAALGRSQRAVAVEIGCSATTVGVYLRARPGEPAYRAVERHRFRRKAQRLDRLFRDCNRALGREAYR